MRKKVFFSLSMCFLSFCLPAAAMVTGQQSLEFHGYFRGGLGMSESGTAQAKFQAPGTRSSYRLGNEPDTNLELQLSYNYEVNETADENAHVQGVFMIDGYKTHGESNRFAVDHLAQAYVSFNRFFENNTQLWIGRRYYDRKFIHILDRAWLNAGQGAHAGAGIENIMAGPGQLNIAVFRYEDTIDQDMGSYLINSTGLDVRWHDVRIGDHSNLTLWLGLTARHKLLDLKYGAKSGYGLGAWLDRGAGNMKNTTVFLYQTGPAITQGDYNARPIREDIEGVMWNLDEATALDISNTLSYELLSNYAVQWTLLFREEDHGLTNNSKFTWYSTGVRPVFYFSNHLNLALEAGIDYIDDEINNRKGTLLKLTTALQVSADRGFYSRPVLRFFITFADWSDELKGQVGNTPGNAPYANETQGWSVGAQTEVWW